MFISYVRENSDVVDQLAKELRDSGVTVWLDRNNIEPGARWKDAIKKAIQSGKFFMACFSREYNERDRTHMGEELTIAIDELRARPSDKTWFIPVLINNTTIPSRRISSVEDLSDINVVKLYEDWNKGFNSILRVLEYDNPKLVRVWHLINIIENPFSSERLHAIHELGTMGTLARPAVPALIEASKNNNAKIRQSSLEALGQIGPAAAEAVPALAAAIHDHHRDVRRSAANALARIGPPAGEAVPALVATLNDPNETVRRSAADALGRSGRPPPRPCRPSPPPSMTPIEVSGGAPPTRWGRSGRPPPRPCRPSPPPSMTPIEVSGGAPPTRWGTSGRPPSRPCLPSPPPSMTPMDMSGTGPPTRWQEYRASRHHDIPRNTPNRKTAGAANCSKRKRYTRTCRFS